MQEPNRADQAPRKKFTKRQCELLAALRFLYPDVIPHSAEATGERDIRPIRDVNDALMVVSNEFRRRNFPHLIKKGVAPQKLPLAAFRLSDEPIAFELESEDGGFCVSLDAVGGLIGIAITKDLLLRRISEGPEEFRQRVQEHRRRNGQA